MISDALEPVTNRETITLDIEFIDDETNEHIALDDVTEIVVQAYSRNDRGYGDYGFRNSPGRGSLSARLSDGDVAVIEAGVIQVRFSTEITNGLCSGTYDIGGTITKDGETVQFLLGQLPILNGVVSR